MGCWGFEPCPKRRWVCECVLTKKKKETRWVIFFINSAREDVKTWSIFLKRWFRIFTNSFFLCCLTTTCHRPHFLTCLVLGTNHIRIGSVTIDLTLELVMSTTMNEISINISDCCQVWSFCQVHSKWPVLFHIFLVKKSLFIKHVSKCNEVTSYSWKETILSVIGRDREQKFCFCSNRISSETTKEFVFVCEFTYIDLPTRYPEKWLTVDSADFHFRSRDAAQLMV